MSNPAVARLTRTLRDVRSLGMGAPLRAGYEASKRFGGHSLLFHHVVPTAATPPPATTPFDFATVPAAANDRTISAAENIANGTIQLFGREFRLGDPPNWESLIHTEGNWPSVEWWRIDLRSDDRPGDVKWAWELGRHRHLVVVARAAHLDPSDHRFRDILNRHLDSWLRTNTPEMGIHWYSNLEISLRAIAWLQILALAGSQLEPEIRARMIRHLHHAGRHLIADLPYTVSTMRNNHLLGDSLGLIALGTAFDSKAANRWRSIGDRIFRQQLMRHMRPDGSMIEDSLSYHRFVLEMLSMRVIIGGASDDVRSAMLSAAQLLARLGALDGPLPQYGDWDEGRLFAVAENPTEIAGSVRLALALAGTGAPATWRADHDEVAWFAQQGIPAPPDPADTMGSDLGAGIARATAGPFTVWLKGGSGPSHGHADLSSVAISHDGIWLTGDPGTGTYNGPLEVRNHYRRSAAHNVATIDATDQLEPHRAFRWVHQAVGKIGEPVLVDGILIMWSVHDAYTRLAPPRRVARLVKVASDAVSVVDYIEGSPVPVQIALTVDPRAAWDSDSSEITIAGKRFRVEPPCQTVTVVHGSEHPYDGWWSETYGTTTPTPVLRFECNSAEPIRWSVTSDPDRGGSVSGNRPCATTTVLFEQTKTRLRVETDGRTFLRSV